ncbi:peptide ABC transporter permease [Bradyrhizobium sp. STM 3562]|uniref:peptide ABC transporter permease n=1 Tax=Bradyrhizobium sp. STM 3562 TaxID=578924 RepID=UPI00388E8260
MVRESPAESAPPPKQDVYPAEKARGGEIILNTPARRWIFIAGLAGAVVLVLVLSFLR